AQVEKLPLLLKHFGIPATSKHVWFRLALALARVHVPGMRIVENLRPVGRPREAPTLTELRAAVHLIIDKQVRYKQRKSVSRAIEILREKEPEKWGKYPPRKLSHWYYEAMKDCPMPKGQSLKEMLYEAYDLPSDE